MRRLSTASVLTSALLTFGACAPARVSLEEAPRSFTASDYGSVYDRWTRSADEFEFGRLAEILHVTATFESFEFRWAYVVRYASDHSFTTEERTALLEESLADARDRHRFFVTLSASRWRDGDLTRESSDWRVLLLDPNGRQVGPVELTRVTRPSADQRAYFPSINKQRHTFRIAFPTVHEDGQPAIPEGADHVILRFAGSAGIVDLRWELSQ